MKRPAPARGCPSQRPPTAAGTRRSGGGSAIPGRRDSRGHRPRGMSDRAVAQRTRGPRARRPDAEGPRPPAGTDFRAECYPGARSARSLRARGAARRTTGTRQTIGTRQTTGICPTTGTRPARAGCAAAGLGSGAGVADSRLRAPEAATELERTHPTGVTGAPARASGERPGSDTAGAGAGVARMVVGDVGAVGRPAGLGGAGAPARGRPSGAAGPGGPGRPTRPARSALNRRPGPNGGRDGPGPSGQVGGGVTRRPSRPSGGPVGRHSPVSGVQVRPSQTTRSSASRSACPTSQCA